MQLDTDGICFDIKKLSDDIEQTKKYNLLDIASYQIQFPNNRFACLILKLKSGKKQEFSFRRQTTDDTIDNADRVIENIHKFLEQHQIEFAPSFYASKKGLYTIIIIIVFLCVPFVLAINLNKSLPAIIIGSIALVMQIISRRVSDLNFYNKWKKI